MARAYNPASWTDGVTVPHVADYQNIATDIATDGDNKDGGGYGCANTAFIKLNPGALPGTSYTVTAASWVGSVATLTIGTHALVVNQRCAVSGVTPSGYNQTDAKITAVTSTTISYALTSNPGAWSSGGTVLVARTVAAAGMLAVDGSNALNIYNGSAWVSSAVAGLAELSINCSSGGTIGLGTASPARQVHVYSTGAVAGARLECTNSSGFALLELKSNDLSWQFGVGGSGSGAHYFYINDSGGSAIRIQIVSGGTISLFGLPSSSSGLTSGGLWRDSSGYVRQV